MATAPFRTNGLFGGLPIGTGLNLPPQLYGAPMLGQAPAQFALPQMPGPPPNAPRLQQPAAQPMGLGMDGPPADAPMLGQGPQLPQSPPDLSGAPRLPEDGQRSFGGRITDFLFSPEAMQMGIGLLSGNDWGEGLAQGFSNVQAYRDRKPKDPYATDDLKEYGFAKSQGFKGTFPEWQVLMKRAGASGTNISVNTGAEGKAFYEQLDKGGADMFNELLTSGVEAESSLVQIGRLRDLLADVPTGAVASMKQFAGNLGVNTEGLDDIQAAQALINKLVPQQRPPGSGPMSDADLELFKASLPRVINAPGGNTLIMDTMQGIAEYQIEQGRIAAAVANREITPAEGRRRLGSLTNPLAQFRSPAGGGASGGGSGGSADPLGIL